jgi:hypothetical protein
MTEENNEIILPEDAEAKTAIASMNSELREVYQDLLIRINALAKNDMMARYNVGTRVARLRGDSAEEIYGEEPVQVLAASLGVSASSLYTMANVAKTWTKEQFQELITRKNKTNKLITFSHLSIVMLANDSSAQLEALESFYNESLSVRDLQALVQEANGGKSGNFNSAKVLPKSAEAGLRSITNYIKKVQIAHETLDKSVFSRIDSDPSKHASEKLITVLEDTQAEMDSLQESLLKDLKKISKTITSLRTEIAGEKIIEEARDLTRQAKSKKRDIGGIVRKAKRGQQKELDT